MSKSGIRSRARNAVGIPEETQRKGSSKDTKKWCRGKKGVPHKYDWIVASNILGGIGPRNGASRSYLLACSECGRHEGQWCFGLSWLDKDGCRCGHHCKCKCGNVHELPENPVVLRT